MHRANFLIDKDFWRKIRMLVLLSKYKNVTDLIVTLLSDWAKEEEAKNPNMKVLA